MRLKERSLLVTIGIVSLALLWNFPAYADLQKGAEPFHGHIGISADGLGVSKSDIGFNLRHNSYKIDPKPSVSGDGHTPATLFSRRSAKEGRDHA